MIGERLKSLRDEKGVTQDDMAELLKIKRQTYSAYERGVSFPDLCTLSVMADYFDVSTDYLLERADIKSCKHCHSVYEPKKDLDKEELYILEVYRKLNMKNKGKAELLIEQVYERQEQEEAQKQITATQGERKAI